MYIYFFRISQQKPGKYIGQFYLCINTSFSVTFFVGRLSLLVVTVRFISIVEMCCAYADPIIVVCRIRLVRLLDFVEQHCKTYNCRMEPENLISSFTTLILSKRLKFFLLARKQSGAYLNRRIERFQLVFRKKKIDWKILWGKKL